MSDGIEGAYRVYNATHWCDTRLCIISEVALTLLHACTHTHTHTHNIIIYCLKEWKKFGDAIDDGIGINPSTTQVAEEVFLALTSNKEVYL